METIKITKPVPKTRPARKAGKFGKNGVSQRVAKESGNTRFFKYQGKPDFAKQTGFINELGGDGITNKYTNPLEFRDLPTSKLLPELSAYNKHMKNLYLAGMIHPDLAVEKGIPVKCYNDLPIPSATVAYHQQYQFSTAALGTFLLSWRPNLFLTTSQDAFSTLTFSNTATGTASTAGNYFPLASNYKVAAEVQRYRLVSALMRVSYNGSVLNQSGTMLSCATFDPFSVAFATTATSIADPLVDRFADFSLIANGLWNQTTNITKSAEGLEALYLPMDYDDYMFQRTGTFYGTALGTVANTLIGPDSEGAHINYVFAGRNFPVSANNILVDVYCNFEVIAGPTSVPILRSSIDDSITNIDHQRQVETIKKVAKTGGLIKKAKSHDWSGVLSQVSALGAKYLPKLLAML